MNLGEHMKVSITVNTDNSSFSSTFSKPVIAGPETRLIPFATIESFDPFWCVFFFVAWSVSFLSDIREVSSESKLKNE